MEAVSRELVPVASDIAFGEGPVDLGDGRYAFTEVEAQAITVVDGTEVRRIAKVPGAPNGMTLGADGALYVANNGGIGPDKDHNLWYADDSIDGCIQRVTLDGEVSQFTGELPGPAPHRPNDLCFGPEGRLYFTDSGNWEEYFIAKSDFKSSPASYRGGSLLLRAPSGETTKLVDIPDFPNGVAITPEADAIIVAQTVTQLLLRYPLNADGTVGDGSVYADLKEAGLSPDGICFATDGSLYVAGAVSDRVGVVGRGGDVETVIDLGAKADPTNLFLTSGKLWVTTGTGRRFGYLEVDHEPLGLFT